MIEVKKPDNRGGARLGAGRKPGPTSTLSTYQVAKMFRLARKYAKLHKKTVDEVLLDFIYGAQEKTSDRLASIKLWKDCTMPRISEGGEADKALGPAVFLPEQRPKLGVIEGGKSA